MYGTALGTLPGTHFHLDQVMMACPQVSENLLSVSKLADQGLDTIFTRDKVIIGRNGTLAHVVTSGQRTGNGYSIEFPLSNAMASSS